MTQVMTRNKVQFFLCPTSGRQQRSRQVHCCRSRAGELERKESAKSSKDRQPRKRCQKCLKHENGKRARKLHQGKPADSEVQSQVSKDGLIQQKD